MPTVAGTGTAAIRDSRVRGPETAEAETDSGFRQTDLKQAEGQGEPVESRHVRLVAVFALALLGLSTTALAATVYFAADQALLRQVLDGMEIEFTVTLDENADPVWTFTFSGITVTIASYDETTPGRYASLLFYAGWAPDTTQVSLSAINDWNRRSRFGRAYVDETGDPAIELDLLLAGGVTAQTLEEYIEIFVATVSDLGVALQL